MFWRKITVAFWLFFFLCGCCLPFFFEWQITGEVYREDGALESPDYRFFRSNDPDQYFTYKLHYPLKITLQRSFTVFPNDCITSLVINNRPYTLPSGNLCDMRNGVLLQGLDEYLLTWDNLFEFKVFQNGNSRSFFMKPSILDPVRMTSFILIGFWFFLLIVSYQTSNIIFSSSNIKFIYWSIFVLFFTLWLLFLIHQDFINIYSADINWHLDYLKLLLRGDRNPPSDMCRQCYHPNLYYRLGELFYKIASLIWWAEPLDFLRIIYYCIWVIGVSFILRMFLLIKYRYWINNFLFTIIVWLFLFWFSFYYIWSKINNDVLGYTMCFIALFFGLRSWFAYCDSDTHALSRNTVFAFCFLLLWARSKTNAIIWRPVWLLWMWLMFFNSLKSTKSLVLFFRTFYKSLFYCLLLFVLLAIPLLKITQLKGVTQIVDNIDRLAGWEPKGWFNLPYSTVFMDFNLHDFITEHDVIGDSTHFFHTFIKTMIFGESFTQHKNIILFPYLAWWWLFLFIFARLVAFALLRKKEYLFFIIWMIIPLIAMIVMRMKIDNMPIMHFRYVLPYLVFQCILIMLWLHYLWKQYRNVSYLLVLFIILYCLGHIYLSLPPYF